MRTVEWDYDHNQLLLIDQRLLPKSFEIASFDNYQSVADAIREMVVRGAPAIGATAGFGFVLAAFQSTAATRQSFDDDLQVAVSVLRAARPTAVNLAWALDRLLAKVSQSSGSIDDLRGLILKEAQLIADEDVRINQQMARNGAELINDGDTVIHHCNTGALATVDWGTALGVVRMAHEMGKNLHVLVDETRPRLQGARLTAWELEQYGISYDIIIDGAAGFHLKSGEVQGVFFGADRVAANGDVANKIGTYMLSLAAVDNNVPAYCVVPTSTIDLSAETGGQILIEQRPMDEVLDIQFMGKQSHPETATARNPAFDITPSRLVTAFVTEDKVVYPPFEGNLR